MSATYFYTLLFHAHGECYSDGAVWLNLPYNPAMRFTYKHHCVENYHTGRRVYYEDHKLFLDDISRATGIPCLSIFDYSGAPSLPN